MEATRNYINVPPWEKELAKDLGAKWDGEKRSWFYYENDDPKIDELHNNELVKIAKWFPPKIEKVYPPPIKLRFFTGEEILEFLGLKREDIKFRDKWRCGACGDDITGEWACGRDSTGYVHFQHKSQEIWHKYCTVNKIERAILYHYLYITEPTKTKKMLDELNYFI